MCRTIQAAPSSSAASPGRRPPAGPAGLNVRVIGCSEAEQAAGTAQRLITTVGKLLPQLSFFSQDRELRDRTTAGNRPMDIVCAGSAWRALTMLSAAWTTIEENYRGP